MTLVFSLSVFLTTRNAQANHALVDGIHVARYFACVEERIEAAESIL